jgi:CDGSH-type Zn-finger protein
VSEETNDHPRIGQVEDGPLRYRRGGDSSKRGVLQGPDRTEVEIRDSALLCRCGASERKPFCDGSHASTGFSSAKKWKPGAGSLIDHVGTRVTIHDNRALCAHVEYCVQELPTVFDHDKRPWIDPDGASAEEIIALCRCGESRNKPLCDGEHRDVGFTNRKD